jgi:carboxyl-terminal processing protease
VKRFFHLAVLSTLILSAVAVASMAQQVAGVPAVKDAALIRREAFQIVWQTIKDKHFDPTFGGVDWDKVRDRYAPRADAAKTDAELHSVLQQMLGELKQSHFNIIPPDAASDVSSSEPQNGGVGIDLRLVDGLAVITRIEPGSSAARAGLRQGFVISQVGNTPVKQLVERFSKSRLSPSMMQLYTTRSILARLSGIPGSHIRVVYQDGRDRSAEANLQVERLKGEMSAPMGNFPAQYTEFEAKRLAGGVGYIRFNIFVALLRPKIYEAISSMSDAPGLVFDLRGNPGGFGAMSSGIAGWLETRETSLGRMNMRSGYTNFAVNPQQKSYRGPVVILIDGLSGSTSEVFSAGMQENGRAVVVGETSMGAALPSIFQKLPTGARFQYAIADFRTPKGVLIEGRGVIPDIEVKLTRQTLLRGGDPQLNEALEQIRKRSASGSRRAANL